MNKTPKSVCYNEIMNKLVILSGLSGGGKTQASNTLEDMGYRCIDQYPPELLEDFVNLIKNDTGNKYSNIVLTIPIIELDKYKKLLDNSEINATTILLKASKDTIINRYKFTRRIHPLLISRMADSLSEAIDLEMDVLKRYENKNAIVIDTTNLSLKQHKQKLDKALNNQNNNLSITFESFGFKNGIPKDADLIFDVRFLENPFYIKKLQNKTGNDKPVKEFVMNDVKTKSFLKKLVSYLDFTIKSYSKDEKRHLMVCIGCTGGQHRSVVVANYLFEIYKKKYLCYLNHREID